jgi:hypothetical protein
MTNIQVQPDISGNRGRAWLCEEEPDKKRLGDLGTWLLEIYKDNPMGELKILHLESLHLTDDQDSAEATHEIFILNDYPKDVDQIDPHNPDLIMVNPWPEIAEYFRAPNDKAARLMAIAAIKKCIDGELPPETSAHKLWDQFIAEQIAA